MKKINIIRFLLPVIVLCSCAGDNLNTQKQAVALRNLGEVYMAQGEYNAALIEFNHALKLYSKDAYLHNDFGLVYMARKKLDLAKTHFIISLDIKPDYPDAMNNLGIVFLEQGNIDHAIKCFEKVTENLIYAAPHKPLTNLGMAYFLKAKYNTAINYYDRALELKPNYSIAQRGLARAYIALGKIDDAIDALKTTTDNAPNFVEAYYDLAEAYRLNSDFQNAINNYEKIIKMFPKSEVAKKARSQVEMLNNNDFEIFH